MRTVTPWLERVLDCYGGPDEYWCTAEEALFDQTCWLCDLRPFVSIPKSHTEIRVVKVARAGKDVFKIEIDYTPSPRVHVDGIEVGVLFIFWQWLKDNDVKFCRVEWR